MKLKRLLQLMTISIFFLNVGMLCTNSKVFATKMDGTHCCRGITLQIPATILGVSTMVAIKGDTVIDVLNPKDFNLQKQIIRLVLDNF